MSFYSLSIVFIIFWGSFIKVELYEKVSVNFLDFLYNQFNKNIIINNDNNKNIALFAKPDQEYIV